jgi:hypothetical protein
MTEEQREILNRVNALEIPESLKPFVLFVVSTVVIPEKTARFVDDPDAVLDETTLTEKEKKILRKKDFRKGVCAYIEAGRPGPPIIEGGG